MLKPCRLPRQRCQSVNFQEVIIPSHQRQIVLHGEGCDPQIVVGNHASPGSQVRLDSPIELCCGGIRRDYLAIRFQLLYPGQLGGCRCGVESPVIQFAKRNTGR